MTSLWNQTAGNLLNEAASVRATPGGGSVAALSGAFGVALLEMALQITRKKGDAPLQAQLETLNRLRVRLRELADEDVRAFQAYVQAARLPQDAPERAAAGEAALQVPLDLARTLVEALTLAPALPPLVHPEVLSDVGAGAALLEGALHAALLTVEINLPHVPQDGRPALEAERGHLRAEGLRGSGAAQREVRQRLQPGG